jgi:hypothetical protein
VVGAEETNNELRNHACILQNKPLWVNIMGRNVDPVGIFCHNLAQHKVSRAFL